jgi:non-homologous end joining protein Ku
MNKKISLIVLVSVLVLGNIFFGLKYYFSNQSLRTAREQVKEQNLNDKVLNFSIMFVDKVLKASGEVSFEDRLKMENAVRDINNQEILDQWTKFTASKTEGEAQTEVKNLLELLIKSIKK